LRKIGSFVENTCFAGDKYGIYTALYCK